MTLSEAERFIAKREQLLRSKLKQLADQENRIKVHIKLVLEVSERLTHERDVNSSANLGLAGAAKHRVMAAVESTTKRVL